MPDVHQSYPSQAVEDRGRNEEREAVRARDEPEVCVALTVEKFALCRENQSRPPTECPLHRKEKYRGIRMTLSYSRINKSICY